MPFSLRALSSMSRIADSPCCTVEGSLPNPEYGSDIDGERDATSPKSVVNCPGIVDLKQNLPTTYSACAGHCRDGTSLNWTTFGSYVVRSTRTGRNVFVLRSL